MGNGFILYNIASFPQFSLTNTQHLGIERSNDKMKRLECPGMSGSSDLIRFMASAFRVSEDFFRLVARCLPFLRPEM